VPKLTLTTPQPLWLFFLNFDRAYQGLDDGTNTKLAPSPGSTRGEIPSPYVSKG
jgi:hypothetical protein